MRLKCSANWEAKIFALSLSVIASWQFSCRRGGIFSLCLVSLLVAFQREPLFDCKDFMYNWNCSDLCICSLYFKRLVKKLKFFLWLGNLVLCYLARAWRLLIISCFMSAGRLLKEFKMCGLIGDVALMADCWIVRTIFSAELSMSEWVFSATFRLIFWSRICPSRLANWLRKVKSLILHH